jgi:hypothetical protein
MARGSVAEGRPVGLFPLWYGIIAPPAAWASQLLVSDSVTEVACGTGSAGSDIVGIDPSSFALIVTVVALLLTLIAGAVSVITLRRLKKARMPETAVERSDFMAVWGIALSSFFLLLILFGLYSSVVLEGCAT